MAGRASTVLVVDDEAAIRLLCRINLELEGFAVLEAASLDDARRLLASEDVDVVLLDVHVGGADGRGLARELRASGRPYAIALLTGSADTDPEDRTDADAVIRKPFTIEELLRTVQSLAAAIQSSA